MNNQDKNNFFKNPIGVIGFFLVLTEAIASIVIVNSTLLEKQNTILVWFIVLFPCLVLVAFYLLVTRHHEKLYSPSDYKDEKNFVNTYNSSTQKDEIKEVTSIEQDAEKSLMMTDNNIAAIRDALVNFMELQKKFVPTMKNLDISEDEKTDYVSSIDEYLLEMEECDKKQMFKVEVSPMYQGTRLVDELIEQGYNANIYRSVFQEKKVVSNAEHKAIWLGSEIPVEMAIQVIKIAKKFYPHLRYIQLVDGSREEPEYVLYEVYIGGSTKTAKERRLIPLEKEDFDLLYQIDEKRSLHSFVKRFEPVDEH